MIKLTAAQANEFVSACRSLGMDARTEGDEGVNVRAKIVDRLGNSAVYFTRFEEGELPTAAAVLAKLRLELAPRSKATRGAIKRERGAT